MTTVTGSNICDATGAKISNATIFFQPSDNKGNPIPGFGLTAGGQVINPPVSALVTNGAFSTSLQDSTQTKPVNICYRVTVLDNGGKVLLGPYIIQPSGASFNFDLFAPNLASIAIVQTGPQGQGFTYRGAWLPGIQFNPFDVFSNGGNSYVVSTAYTSGGTFGATDTANTSVFAASGTISGVVGTPLTVPSLIIGNTSTDIAFTGGWAVVDSKNRAALYVDTAGDTNIYGDALVAGNLDVDGDITATGGTLEDVMLINPTVSGTLEMESSEIGGVIDAPIPTGTGSNLFSVGDAVVDKFGHLSEARLPDGSIWFPAGVRVGGATPGEVFTTVLAPAGGALDSDGTAFYSATDASGFLQVFRKGDSGTITQLTTGSYNNTSPAIQNGLIVFVTDRTGTAAAYQMDKAGLVQVPLGTDMSALTALAHSFTTGQSLAVAHAGLTPTNTVLSTTQPYDNLMLNGGPRCNEGNTGSAIAPALMTSLVPLVELASIMGNGQDDAGSGETITSGSINRASASALLRGKHLRMVGTVNAFGGQTYAIIKKGTTTYANGLAQITAAHTLAAAAGMTHAVRWMNLVHGESDDSVGTSIATYAADLAQWISDYTTDVKAITGQAYGFPMCMSQTSQWTSFGHIAVGTTSFAMLQAMSANFGKMLIACAKYFFPTSFWNGDGVHMNASGYQWLSEYHGRVMSQYLLDGTFRRPLHIRKATIIGNKIYVAYWMPTPTDSLVIDTALVTPPTANAAGLNGFEYYDNSGAAPAITGVAINGTSGVVVTLASAPTATAGNRHIAYARTGTVNALAGSTTGARGCLRTNNSDQSMYGYPNLFDWALHDDFIF